MSDNNLKAAIEACGIEEAERIIAKLKAKPSLMVGFSEEEIERIAAKLHPALGGQWSDDAKAKQLTKRSYAAEAIRYAQEHSQAVSIDTIMEVVMGWCCATKDAEEDLRERLEKLTQQQAQ